MNLQLIQLFHRYNYSTTLHFFYNYKTSTFFTSDIQCFRHKIHESDISQYTQPIHTLKGQLLIGSEEHDIENDHGISKPLYILDATQYTLFGGDTTAMFEI